jgi:hypothetical protein
MINDTTGGRNSLLVINGFSIGGERLHKWSAAVTRTRTDTAPAPQSTDAAVADATPTYSGHGARQAQKLIGSKEAGRTEAECAQAK